MITREEDPEAVRLLEETIEAMHAEMTKIYRHFSSINEEKRAKEVAINMNLISDLTEHAAAIPEIMSTYQVSPKHQTMVRRVLRIVLEFIKYVPEEASS